MEKCWARNPSDRPSFKSLEDALDLLYEDELHKVLIKCLYNNKLLFMQFKTIINNLPT